MQIIPSRPKRIAHCRECGQVLRRGSRVYKVTQRYYTTSRYESFFVCKDCIYKYFDKWTKTFCEEYYEATSDREPGMNHKNPHSGKYANPNHNLISKLSYYKKKGNKEKYNEVLRQLLPFDVF